MTGLVRLLGGGVADTIKSIGSVFAQNREQKAVRSHDADMATLAQYAAEFHARANRTWLDSLSDSLNRLVRPLFGLACFFSLIAIPVWPEHALYVSQALAAMPDGYWVLLSIIVTFYFGGRMQVKAHDFRLKSDAVAAAKNIREVRRLLTPDRNEDRYLDILQSDTEPMPNWAILEWSRRQEAGA